MSGRHDHDRGAPSSVLQQAVDRFEQDDGFIPCATFQGGKAGFHFGRGPAGVGYYEDTPAGAAPSTAAAEDEEGPGPSTSRPVAAPRDAADLLREAEEAAGEPQVEFVDAKTLRRLLGTLDRKYKTNLEQRAKHADEPQRFLESEIELDEAVKAMMAVASSPELYPDLVAAGCVPILLSLLHHDNGDIAAGAIELLADLTDADAVEESEAEARVLVDALLANGLLEALAQRLAALNERIPEEATAVANALSVIENCAELRSEAAAAAATQTPLLEWLLRRLRPREEVDGNKQYAAEVLVVVLQAGGDAARQRFAQLEGVDRALQGVAPYRSRDPATVEEEEFVENVFDALCISLLVPRCQEAFVAGEGVELMLLVLRSRRAARAAALKCLDFATTRCPPACDRLVDQGGLKTVFAAFMGKLKPKGAAGKKRDDTTAAEEEERCVSIIANLMMGATGQSRRDRVAAKFVENEFEKCDRLLELLLRYEGRVAAAGAQPESSDEEEALVDRLGAGLFTLQRCVFVAAALWASGDAGVRQRILALLHQRGRTLGLLRGVLLEYRSTLGEEGGEEERTRQAGMLTEMLAALGHVDGEDAPAEAGRQGGEHAEEAAAAGALASSEGGGGGADKRQRSENREGYQGPDPQRRRVS